MRNPSTTLESDKNFVINETRCWTDPLNVMKDSISTAETKQERFSLADPERQFKTNDIWTRTLTLFLTDLHSSCVKPKLDNTEEETGCLIPEAYPENQQIPMNNERLSLKTKKAICSHNLFLLMGLFKVF